MAQRFKTKDSEIIAAPICLGNVYVYDLVLIIVLLQTIKY